MWKNHKILKISKLTKYDFLWSKMTFFDIIHTEATKSLDKHGEVRKVVQCFCFQSIVPKKSCVLCAQTWLYKFSMLKKYFYTEIKYFYAEKRKFWSWNFRLKCFWYRWLTMNSILCFLKNISSIKLKMYILINGGINFLINCGINC